MSAALSLVLLAATAGANPSRAEETSRAIICGLIDRAAAQHALPPSFLTRLIWRESSFRPGARSRAGAQGIAQFMPSTADERGLVDPFDPETAIPASASYLSDLKSRFGSLDLAAAAYNAGPGRVAKWKSGQASLPDETRAHVRFITGADLAMPNGRTAVGSAFPAETCLTTLASLRTTERWPMRGGLAEATLPWGVQLVAGPNKAKALGAYTVLQQRHATILAGQSPMVITTQLGGRGNRSYYRVRVAFETRGQADKLCRAMRKAGASCLSVRN